MPLKIETLEAYAVNSKTIIILWAPNTNDISKIDHFHLECRNTEIATATKFQSKFLNIDRFYHLNNLKPDTQYHIIATVSR